MAKRKRRPDPPIARVLEPLRTGCATCGGPLSIAYATMRTVVTLDRWAHFTANVRCCQARTCRRCHRPYRPGDEGGRALSHGEFGLDVIAWAGIQRYPAHQIVPGLYQELRARGLGIAEMHHERLPWEHWRRPLRTSAP